MNSNVKLIPVIEVGYANQGIERPKNWPYWEYPKEWEAFKERSYKRAGFQDPFKPFFLGSSLYEISLISDENLTKIIVDHTSELRKGIYRREESCPLFGGYVLEIMNEKLFYPQCCGDLSDIDFWKNLSTGRISYYEGHPAPIIDFREGEIHFDLNVQEFGEEFDPIPLKRNFRLNKHDLAKAIIECEEVLEKFAERIRSINEKKKMNLDNIEDLLIWGLQF